MKEYNKGMLWQMKNNPVQQPRKHGITREDLFMSKLYIFGETIKHTEEIVNDLEDLHQAIEHYRFLSKYNLA